MKLPQEKQAKILKLYHEKKEIPEIAHLVPCSYWTIKRLLEDNKLPIPRHSFKKEMTDEEKQRILHDYAILGLSISQISTETKYTFDRIRTLLTEYGIEIRHQQKRTAKKLKCYMDYLKQAYPKTWKKKISTTFDFTGFRKKCDNYLEKHPVEEL